MFCVIRVKVVKVLGEKVNWVLWVKNKKLKWKTQVHLRQIGQETLQEKFSFRENM